MNENFRPCTVWGKKKNTQAFGSANTGRLNLHLKRRTKCETVAEIQDTQVAKFWSNEHVILYEFAGSVSVSNCDTWPTYKGD
jgi:hypothetical protein